MRIPLRDETILLVSVHGERTSYRTHPPHARHYYECLAGEPRTFEIGLRGTF